MRLSTRARWVIFGSTWAASASYLVVMSARNTPIPVYVLVAITLAILAAFRLVVRY